MRLSQIIVTALLTVSFAGLQAATAPLNISSGANTAFADEQPDDRRGGWTDQGSNDMRLLKPGTQTLGGVSFAILDDKATGGKSCIVLSANPRREYLPKHARVDLPEAAKGDCLYLLHAMAMGNKEKNLVGKLTVEYTDGTAKEYRIRSGRDVDDWSANRGFSNSARVWSTYNNNSQISLYASMFKLDKPVKALRFQSGDDGVWMIAAASIGDQVYLRPIAAIPVLNNDYPSPATPDKAALAAAPRNGTPKNIIFIIGDGMGQGSVKYASLYAHGEPQKLVMDQLPVQGMATTHSLQEVTDSAASGTALSSGYKTNNGFVGMDSAKTPFRSIAEEARDAGKSIGIITTDGLHGATPSAFYAHVPSRGMGPEIAVFALKSKFDILIGTGLPEPSKSDLKLADAFTAKGYLKVDNLESFQKADKLPVYGFVAGYKDTRLLAAMGKEAFRLLSKNPNGFFVMIEGSFPDGGGHGNNPDNSLNGVLMNDFLVEEALKFASSRSDTLIVVTADHETGGLHCTANPAEPKRPHIYYTTKSHTAAPVNVFAYGPGSNNFAGVLDNTDIPKRMAKLWSLPLGRDYKE